MAGFKNEAGERSRKSENIGAAVYCCIVKQKITPNRVIFFMLKRNCKREAFSPLWRGEARR